jgi:phenylacetate-CoA ligase
MPSTPRNSLLVYLNNSVFTTLYRATRRNYLVWHWIAMHYHPILSKLARFNTCSICDWASYKIPAYQKCLQETKATVNYWDFEPTQYPETNKADYIKKYSFADRCKNGKIPTTMTTIDESSGSTGKPYNWIRTIDELRDVHTISSNYIRMEIPDKKLITLNAFSMGSWATGINMTLGLLPVSIVKSIGPDIDKIIDTLETFGSTTDSGFSYIICGYPPFIKHLCEEMKKREFDFDSYRLYAIVGGEGMTEAMRDYLEKYFLKVRSGYGATDIQLGIGGETDFTIWARKQLISNSKLRTLLLGDDENRIPMLFHYNPLDHFIEINAKSEVVISINSFKVLSPRLRYNIEDEGRIFEYKEFLQLLILAGYTKEEIAEVSKTNPIKMPILMIFGRKDGTISYMGANIYPQDVEQGIYQSQYADQIENFILSLEQNSKLESKTTINIELKEGILVQRYPSVFATIPEPDQQKSGLIIEMEADIADNVRSFMAQVNKDFRESLREDPTAGQIDIRFYEYNSGIFANKNTKQIKNKYLLKPYNNN